MGISLAEGQLIPREPTGPVRVLLRGEVTDSEGGIVSSPLVFELDVGPGRIVYVSFPAPEPRAEEWWSGSPAAWTLPDGSWDGAGGLIDRLFFRL